MGRKIGWEDESVTGSFRQDRERQYRGKEGEKHVVRAVGECIEYRQHFVDDVLDPAKDGTPKGFSMNCAREYNDDNGEWEGDCLGCDREYELSTRYCTGLLHLATYKGRSRTPQKIEPENAVHWWDFGGDKYRKLSDLALELSRAENPKKLHQVEIVITCEPGGEGYQKLNINLSQAKALTTRGHIEEYQETGPKMVAEAVKAPNASEQKRRLKKKRRKRGGDDDAPARRSSSTSTGKPAADDGDPADEQPETEDLDALLAEI